MNDPTRPPSEPELPSLPSEIPPPGDLEEAVVAGLARRGLLAGRRGGRRRWSVAAAAVLLTGGGFALGRLASTAGPATTEPAFALFLEDTPGSVPSTPDSVRAQIAAYREWAGRLRDDGRLVLAEKLAEEERIVGEVPVDPGASTGYPVGGLFIIRAADFDEAIAMARSAPHVLYGGRIIVRPIDPT